MHSSAGPPAGSGAAATASSDPAVHCAYVGLGANLGDARSTLVQARAALAALPGVSLTRASPWYGSAPLDAGGPDYVNGVVELHTTRAPLDLLHALQALEQQAGRERPYRNAPRVLDLDLLLYDGWSLDSPELTLPHPRMQARAFVLRPLADIAPQRVAQQALDAVARQALWRLD